MEIILVVTLAVIITLVISVRLATFHPRELQRERVYNSQTAPTLKRGQKIKLLSWNVQFMAGNNYVFWVDMLDFNGPDDRPSKEAIPKTFEAVDRVIREENPDIIIIAGNMLEVR